MNTRKELLRLYRNEDSRWDDIYRYDESSPRQYRSKQRSVRPNRANGARHVAEGEWSKRGTPTYKGSDRAPEVADGDYYGYGSKSGTSRSYNDIQDQADRYHYFVPERPLPHSGLPYRKGLDQEADANESFTQTGYHEQYEYTASTYPPHPMDNRGALNHQGRPVESHYGKGPKGYRRTDEQILDDASMRLFKCGDVNASELELCCKDGVLTLSGSIESRWMKRRAQHCVEDVYGVNDVRNLIKVLRP